MKIMRKPVLTEVWRFSDAGVKENIGIAPRYFGDVRDCESGKKPFLQLFSLWLFLVTELLFSAFPGGGYNKRQRYLPFAIKIIIDVQLIIIYSNSIGQICNYQQREDDYVKSGEPVYTCLYSHWIRDDSYRNPDEIWEIGQSLLDFIYKDFSGQSSSDGEVMSYPG